LKLLRNLSSPEGRFTMTYQCNECPDRRARCSSERPWNPSKPCDGSAARPAGSRTGVRGPLPLQAMLVQVTPSTFVSSVTIVATRLSLSLSLIGHVKKKHKAGVLRSQLLQPLNLDTSGHSSRKCLLPISCDEIPSVTDETD
jgi:hypothetical protein